jgi:hypothetical protein
MTWIERLEASRSTILTGTWDKAEPAWTMLLKAQYDDDEFRLWLKLQVDILEHTRGDMLKSGLRKNAMQTLYDAPSRASVNYLGWLRSGLRTNLFDNPDVAAKARELVSYLELFQQRGF